MITSLNRIGKQLRENKDPLDSIISTPKLSPRDQERNKYVLKIIFDVDNNDIIISKTNLVEYSQHSSPKDFHNINTLQGRYRKIYLTTEFKKVDSFRITFFGNENSSIGDFASYIAKEYPELIESKFYAALESIFTLKELEAKIDRQNIQDILGLTSNENLVLITSEIVNSNLDLSVSTKLFTLEGYKEFLNKMFLKPSSIASEENLCYITGELRNDIKEAGFKERESLNKIYVDTTINYLANFQKSGKNYRLSEESRLNLEEASSYLLENLSTRICGIPHLIVPTFLDKTKVNFAEIKPSVLKLKELAFDPKHNLNNALLDIESEIRSDLFWLNFIAYDTKQKQYFKIVNLIKDIPQFYFINLLQKLIRTSMEFSDYYEPRFTFNLHSIYNLIPVRCNKKGEILSKHNEALLIIKDIIEKRKISFDRLINSFVELILIHQLKRFRQYKQFSWRQESNFDREVFYAVFNYSILFKALIDLDLLEDHNFLGDTMNSETGNQIENYINDFFSKMNYSQPQKAMFFLGRMLDNIAYAQYLKDHKSKPVLGKINFNGLDKDDIQRLYKDLFEKARQYNTRQNNILNKVEYNSSNFMQYFNPNDWNENGLNKKEALFFLLAGYSFGIALSKDRKQSLIENEENDDE